MQKVFVSYSHENSEFADRLVSDLHLSQVPATYDKWVLNVGDSIITRIAQEVSEADRVIALLSSASVNSNWVGKELSLAVTGEISSKKIKVLPALIEDCALPGMLLDKFYADFRFNYYFGLRALLRALLPEGLAHRDAIPRVQKLEETEVRRLEFGKLLERGDRNAIRNWLHINPLAFAGLFGHQWRVFEVISSPAIPGQVVDFAIINGQSFRYDISLICLRELVWPGDATVCEQADSLVKLLRWCRHNVDSFRRSLALRMVSEPGAIQLIRGRERLNLDVKVFIGRRSEYGEGENAVRDQVFQGTGRDVDIVSYDRIVDAFGWRNNRS